MAVKSDEEAIRLINDSAYGLTCSIWTKDDSKFAEIMPEIEAGTVFQNRFVLFHYVVSMTYLFLRCDYLDPALAWTGVKDSGRGVSLSSYGYDAVTQMKSVHIKKV